MGSKQTIMIEIIETISIALYLSKFSIQSKTVLIYSSGTGHCWPPSYHAHKKNRRIVQLQSLRLNWGTGQTTFDLLVITTLCTGPQRAAIIWEGESCAEQKMDSFWMACGAWHRLEVASSPKNIYIYIQKKKSHTSKLDLTAELSQ